LLEALPASHLFAVYNWNHVQLFILSLTVMTAADNKYVDEGNVEQDLGARPIYLPDLDDKAMETRIVRKIDMRILPFIYISYLINYLDRVSGTQMLKRPANVETGQLGYCADT
jgi:hypothetical protein